MLNTLLLAGANGTGLDSYDQIIGASLIILLSYVFDFIAKKFKIPSVILLIGLGMGLTWAAREFLDIQIGDSIIPILNILGTIGIILIVLEAALDLKLHKEKTGLIVRSFVVALFVLLVTVAAVAFVLVFFLKIDFLSAMVYATPLSIMSSAIVIPSVGGLAEEKKEFMIYEATFSDILGIILFFFLTNLSPEITESSGTVGQLMQPLLAEGFRILLTIIISVLIGYILVWFISGVTRKANFFTIFALLALFYALGKKYHLSSLITILIFGLILNNEQLFFRGWFDKFISKDHHNRITEDFTLLTHQFAFLVRTFFFVAFGLIISPAALKDPNVLMIGGAILLVIYAVRFAHLQMVQHHSISPELFIAPRGLITILLFFSIPAEYQLESFNDGIMSVVIIVTALIMMFALMFSKNEYRVIEDITTHNQTGGLLGFGRDVDQEAS